MDIAAKARNDAARTTAEPTQRPYREATPSQDRICSCSEGTIEYVRFRIRFDNTRSRREREATTAGTKDCECYIEPQQQDDGDDTEEWKIETTELAERSKCKVQQPERKGINACEQEVKSGGRNTKHDRRDTKKGRRWNTQRRPVSGEEKSLL